MAPSANDDVPLLGLGLRSARHRALSELSGDKATQRLLEKHEDILGSKEDILGRHSDAVGNYLKPSQRLRIALEQVLGIGERSELERLLQCPFTKPSQCLRAALSKVMDIGEPGSWEVMFRELRAARWEAAALAKTIKLVQSLLGSGGNIAQADAYSQQPMEPDSEPASPGPRADVRKPMLSERRWHHKSRNLRRPSSMPAFQRLLHDSPGDAELLSEASAGSNDCAVEWEHAPARSPQFGRDDVESVEALPSTPRLRVEKRQGSRGFLQRLSPEGQEAYHQMRHTLDSYLRTVDLSSDEDLRVARERLGKEIAAARRFGIPEVHVSEAVSWQHRLVRACVMKVLESVKDADMTSMTALSSVKDQLSNVINDARQQGLVEADLVQAETWRRRVHNVMEDLKGSIRVFCRVRPVNQKERDDGDLPALRSLDSMTLEASRPCVRYNSASSRCTSVDHDGDRDTSGHWSDGDGRDMEVAQFKFDGVFTPATQQAVFEDCRCLMQSAFDGYNVTIIAYGQTGSGKTYTINGRPDEPGLAPQMVTEIYRIIGQDSDRFHHRVTASMVELYRNELVDLLHVSQSSAASKKSSVRNDKDGQFHNVVEEECPDVASLTKVMARGNMFRTTGATAMNARSSRSHLIQTVKIHRLNRGTSGELMGKIVLVDLAGSERLKKSLVTGNMQKEAIEINKSLSALGDVLEALTQGREMVPYRNHKLTQILQDSLGRTAKTLMFVHCAPTKSNIEETLASLKYATRAKKIAPRHSMPSSRGHRPPSVPPAMGRSASAVRLGTPPPVIRIHSSLMPATVRQSASEPRIICSTDT
jgi:hypothetical protein